MNPVLFKAMVKFCTTNQLFTYYEVHLAIKLARKTSKLSERLIVLGKRLELLKARQKNGSALILVENGSVFVFAQQRRLQKLQISFYEDCKFRFKPCLKFSKAAKSSPQAVV